MTVQELIEALTKMTIKCPDIKIIPVKYDDSEIDLQDIYEDGIVPVKECNADAETYLALNASVDERDGAIWSNGTRCVRTDDDLEKFCLETAKGLVESSLFSLRYDIEKRYKNCLLTKEVRNQIESMKESAFKEWLEESWTTMKLHKIEAKHGSEAMKLVKHYCKALFLEAIQLETTHKEGNNEK